MMANGDYFFCRRYIAYATEPVVGSLANVLGDYPNDISRAHATTLNVSSYV